MLGQPCPHHCSWGPVCASERVSIFLLVHCRSPQFFFAAEEASHSYRTSPRYCKSQHPSDHVLLQPWSTLRPVLVLARRDVTVRRGGTEAHPCCHTWAQRGMQLSYLHHSLLHRFITQSEQLKGSFPGRKAHFQCQFHNQTGEKNNQSFHSWGAHVPLSLPANPVWAETGTDVGKVAGSVSSDTMLILTVHPFLKLLKNTLWADVSFVWEGFNKVFAALQLSLPALLSRLRPSLARVSFYGTST